MRSLARRRTTAVSIHASRAGRDAIPAVDAQYLTVFQSTRPVRDATRVDVSHCVRYVKFQSTRPVRDATKRDRDRRRWRSVSIHASREGRDVGSRSPVRSVLVSIHASRAGRDYRDCWDDVGDRSFQSTRPVRDATAIIGDAVNHAERFNPRVPCGTRHDGPIESTVEIDCFNPRVPCGTRHAIDRYRALHRAVFQSTRPVRDATRQHVAAYPLCSIGFNPRVPCGTRLGTAIVSTTDVTCFNPRVP